MDAQTKRKKQRVLLTFSVLVLLVSVLAFSKSYILDNSLKAEVSQEKSSQNGVQITKSKTDQETKINFEQINFDISEILKDKIVQDLPKSAIIELKIGSTSYTLAKDSVNVGSPSSPDLTISVPSEYLSQISLGLCEVIKKANQDKNIAIETHSSQAALIWKYKSMLKYKECLG